MCWLALWFIHRNRRESIIVNVKAITDLLWVFWDIVGKASSNLRIFGQDRLMVLFLKIGLVLPWLVWPSRLSAGLGTEGSWVQFPVRACAWVVGQVPGCGRAGGNQLMFLTHRCLSPSFPPSLPCSLKINKWNLKITLKRASFDWKMKLCKLLITMPYVTPEPSHQQPSKGNHLKLQGEPVLSRPSGDCLGDGTFPVSNSTRPVHK